MPAKTIIDRWKMLAQVAVVYSGLAARGGLALVIGALVARWFGPEQFGIYNFFLSTMIIFQAMFGESFDAGVVRYYAQFESRDKPQANSVIGNSILIRLTLALPIMCMGLAIAPWIANRFFEPFVYTTPIRLGLTGALIYALLSFLLAILQAQEQFLIRSIIYIVVNLLRLLFLAGLFTFGWLSIPLLIWSHLLSLTVGAGVAGWVVRHVLSEARIDIANVRGLITFSQWSASGHFLFIVSSSLAVPLLAYLSSAELAGIYAAAASLILVVELIIGAIMTVQLPTFSRESEPQALRLHIRRSLALYFGMALLCCPFFLLAKPLTLLVYGPEFQASALVLQILLIGAIASLVSHPLSQIFYAINRPQLVTMISLVSTLVWVGAALLLIPDQGAIGAALSTILSRIVGAAMILLLVWTILWREVNQK